MADTNEKKKLRIGVLALQGAFTEHQHLLHRLTEDVDSTVQVKTEAALLDPTLDALILPGGESTTMALIAERTGLMEPLRNWVKAGKPVWGTCAGMILLSNEAHKIKIGGQSLIGGLDVTVKRNAFGAQVDSFVGDLSVPALTEPERLFPGVFIRAPIIETVKPEKVQVLARVVKNAAPTSAEDGDIVAVRQGHILATAFHPELTSDERFHRYFIDMVREVQDQTKA
ncbi:PdxT/SNO family [Fimicolochytrium jonesii]|uniref:PdxT/SNO family n=1 Tax=Fimicolochytrium jonesii TaxID=1396493 RepID=UPI0022FE9210|nr:PdxT/SNO family [Fimicolochytrium jonesii]KAI8823516.1 PdxT/SNO family [Fimicolochytrium jonesii]